MAKIVVMDIFYIFKDFLMLRYLSNMYRTYTQDLKKEGRLLSAHSFTSFKLTIENLTWHFEFLEIFLISSN